MLGGFNVNFASGYVISKLSSVSQALKNNTSDKNM